MMVHIINISETKANLDIARLKVFTSKRIQASVSSAISKTLFKTFSFHIFSIQFYITTGSSGLFVVQDYRTFSKVTSYDKT